MQMDISKTLREHIMGSEKKRRKEGVDKEGRKEMQKMHAGIQFVLVIQVILT